MVDMQHFMDQVRVVHSTPPYPSSTTKEGINIKKQLVYNNSNRKQQRRYLRSRMTKSEKQLWSKIRKKQLGYIFRRQHIIGPYLVDFYCPAKRLIIEIDRNQHKYSQDYDNFRSSYFSALDIMVIRFWNWELEIFTYFSLPEHKLNTQKHFHT